MKNVGQQQRHMVEVSFGRQRRMTELSRYAKLRLTGWGVVIRAITLARCPSGSPGSINLTKTRVDFDTLDRMLQIQARATDAAETDDWLHPLKETSPHAFRATVIRYVEREYGGHQLSGAEQVRRFHKATGLGETTYYRKLDRVLQHICAEILLKENPELKYRSELQYK